MTGDEEKEGDEGIIVGSADDKEEIHSPLSDHTCPHCQKNCFRAYTLTRHLVVHMEEKPFQCDVCHKGFSQKSNMYVIMCILLYFFLCWLASTCMSYF
jgi:hypothetical protein